MQSEGRIVLSGAAAEDAPLSVAVTLNQGPLAPATHQSLRIAPGLVGRAAIEMVDADAVMGHADPDDIDGDGVSGRPRMVEIGGRRVLGRYGWKVSAAGLEEQIADAFATDLGMSSALRPFPHGDCTALETECMAAPTGESDRYGGHEVPDEVINLIAVYLRSLPSPQPDALMLGGNHLFAATGCATCHVPSLPTINGGTVSVFTDLLLHDMGGGLDDGVGDRGVASAEWRTAPLIGMAPGDGRRYLHDGRVATIDAAIRAHGGEASGAVSRYLALSESERQALVAYVESL